MFILIKKENKTKMNNIWLFSMNYPIWPWTWKSCVFRKKDITKQPRCALIQTVSDTFLLIILHACVTSSRSLCFKFENTHDLKTSQYDLDLCFQGYEGSLLKVTNKNGKNTSVSMNLHVPICNLAILLMGTDISVDFSFSIIWSCFFFSFTEKGRYY